MILSTHRSHQYASVDIRAHPYTSVQISLHSDASTDPQGDSEAGSDSEADELSECVAGLHVGDPGDFLKHLDELLREFIRAGSGRASEGLSFCSLLLVAFMRVGAQNAGDDFLDADAREKWMECIRGRRPAAPY